MTDRVAAIILAAGASTRMGAPKALLRWRGRTFVGCTIDCAREVGCAPIVVVQGATVLPAGELSPALVCTNPAWREGPFGSLQAGLRALAAEGAVIVATVDRPHVARATWAALIAAHRSEPDAVWQPRYAERRGHPLLLPAWLLPRVLERPRSSSLHELLAEPDVAASRRELVVDDAAVLDNLDTPEDLARLPP